MSKGYICQYWQGFNTFVDSRITQYMHQIACIYIVVPQQKWNNTYLETTCKLKGVNIAKFCFQDKELTNCWLLYAYHCARCQILDDYQQPSSIYLTLKEDNVVSRIFSGNSIFEECLEKCRQFVIQQFFNLLDITERILTGQ